jgi:GDPmannose 4,6-dehydratase
VDVLLGDASKIKNKTGWKPKVGFKALARMMVDHDMELAKKEKILDDHEKEQ